MIVQFIDFIQKRLKLVGIACCVVLGLIVVWSLTVDTSHAHSWAEKAIPAFWSLFGLGACAVIIGIARLVGRTGIMTREDYYDD